MMPTKGRKAQTRKSGARPRHEVAETFAKLVHDGRRAGDAVGVGGIGDAAQEQPAAEIAEGAAAEDPYSGEAAPGRARQPLGDHGGRLALDFHVAGQPPVVFAGEDLLVEGEERRVVQRVVEHPGGVDADQVPGLEVPADHPSAMKTAAEKQPGPFPHEQDGLARVAVDEPAVVGQEEDEAERHRGHGVAKICGPPGRWR